MTTNRDPDSRGPIPSPGEYLAWGLSRILGLTTARNRSEFLEFVRPRMGRRRSPWNLLLLPAGLGAWGVSKGRLEAVTIINDGMLIANTKRIADLATKYRLPSIGFDAFADAGGLMRYGANLSEMFRRAAYFVDKILRGTKPADLPVEQPTKFDLVINVKTAKTLTLTISQSLLRRADLLIE